MFFRRVFIRKVRPLLLEMAQTKVAGIYDSNRVTIEGHTDIAFTEDVAGAG
jgi:hypothetical protein